MAAPGQAASRHQNHGGDSFGVHHLERHGIILLMTKLLNRPSPKPRELSENNRMHIADALFAHPRQRRRPSRADAEAIADVSRIP
jgi:hypothetical protein